MFSTAMHATFERTVTASTLRTYSDARLRAGRLAPPSVASCAVLLASLVLIGCTDPASTETPPAASQAPAATAAPPTAILVDLPPGIEVALNGRARGATPQPAFEVEPGLYTVTLTAACKKVDVQLEVRAGETAKVDQARAAALELATLELAVRNQAGESIEHAVALGDAVLGGGKGTSTTLVPPCEARMKVTSEGLGGFIEDIDFGKEARVKREVVLLPGPDMVRIHGGPFTPGTGGSRMYDEMGLCFPKPYYKVEVEGFAIDRTEVTAEQWLACRKAGGCERSRPKWGVTKKPREGQYLQCSVEVLELNATPIRSGREEYPMNCIAQWEAEDYCRWAGKRLPTDVEWEYVARSRRSDYTFPWGNDYSPCINKDFRNSGACQFGDGALKAPCAFPEMNTEQGVCDMMGNVMEMVTYERFSGRQELYERGYEPYWIRPENKQYQMGSSGGAITTCTISIDGLWDEWWQEPNAGFRCARDIDASVSRE